MNADLACKGRFRARMDKLTKTGERKNVKVNNYSLTLDMAKELSMVENNKIGHIFLHFETEHIFANALEVWIIQGQT